MTNAHARPTLFSQIELRHGDIGLAGRTILAAEQLTRSLGITLRFVSAQDFLAVNQANRATWLPLGSMFDTRFSQLDPDNAFFIVGENTRGETVACQACRYFDWQGTTFKEECESLRFWYADPATQKNQGETSTVTALAARGTTGRIAYSGAAWYRPDYRGKGLVEYLPRLARAYARSLWDTEATITLMAENNIRKGVFPRNGYKNLEWAVDVVNNQSGTIRFGYIWTKTDEMEADLAEFLTGLAQVSGGKAVGVGAK
jgi:hypothetical protein